MKLTIAQSAFAELIETAKNGVATKPVDPILSALFIEASNQGKLTIVGTDLGISIKTAAVANIQEEGTVALNAKLLADTVTNLPSGELEIEVNERTCTITHSTGNCRIIGGNPEDFPSIPESKEPIEISIPSKKLESALQASLYCSSIDETKFILTGVHFQINSENLTCASTDGHRLAFVSSKLDINDELEPIKFTVPRRSLIELETILRTTTENSSCTIKVGNNTIQFILPNAEITSRLLEGEYPHIQNIIPRSFANELIVERKGIEAILKRISHFADKRNKIVKILWEVDKQTATLMTGESDIGDAVDSIAINKVLAGASNDIAIGLNSGYLLEALKHIPTDEVVFRFNNCLQPIILSPVGGLIDQLALVMPIDIGNVLFNKPEAASNTDEHKTDNPESTEELVINNTVESEVKSDEAVLITEEVSSQTNDAEEIPSTDKPTNKSKSRKRKQDTPKPELETTIA